MRGLFHKLAPFTPDSAGAISVFADLPALVVPVDMNGTVSTFRNRVGVLQESKVRVCSALGTREMSYVFGDPHDIVRECLSLQRRFGGEFFVLVHGPVSAMTGVDLKGACLALTAETGCVAVSVDCTGNEPYDKGISKALLEVFGMIEGGEDAAARRPGTINMLGLNSVDHNDPALRVRLCEIVEQATGKRVLSVWGCRDGWDAWEQACGADENIVVATCALSLAKKMQQVWGMPYRCIDELAIPAAHGNACSGAHAPSKHMLVVYEQLFANVVRQQLEQLGHSVDVASFFTLDRAHRREGDVRLQAESDLAELAAAGAYDAVFIDQDAASCVPSGVAHIPLEHSAISFLAPEAHQYPVPLTDGWLKGLPR